MNRGITVISPTESWEGESTIETWVTVHERIVGIQCLAGSLQLGIVVGFCRNLTVRHGEHVQNHARGRKTITTCVVRANIALPHIVLRSIVNTSQDDGGVIKSEEDSLTVCRLANLCEDAGEVATVLVIAGRIESITASVNDRQVVLHLIISLCPASLVIAAVEQWTSPQYQYTTLQSQSGTRGDTTIVGTVFPTAIGSLSSQQQCGIVQVFHDEIDGLLGGRTWGVVALCRFQYFFHNGYTTIPFHEVIITPCAEEVCLTKQGTFLGFCE